jgi:enoyl-CoA hydratase/carnithine racemase
MEQIDTLALNGILRITIQRPEKLNALTLAMYDALTEALNEAERNAGIRVIMIQGTPRCFSSGNDLADFAENPPAGEDSPVFRFLRALSQAGKPIIAMVSGPAVGVGTTMLLHCDLVYADETARFQLPFVSLGLCPEAASSFLLPRLIGHQRAAELLLLGETITAERAVALGLVNQLFPQNELKHQVLAKAAALAKQPAAAVQLTKSLLKAGDSRQVAEVMSEEGDLFLRCLAGTEAQQAIAQFMRKTPS